MNSRNLIQSVEEMMFDADGGYNGETLIRHERSTRKTLNVNYRALATHA